MSISMTDQIRKLKNIIKEVERFYFSMNKEYVGPVNPVSIISYSSPSKLIQVKALVIAEKVPAIYLPFGFLPFLLDSNHLEAVVAYLDDNFEFQHYYPETKELKGLSVLIGDKEYSYDGTAEGASDFFKQKNWSYEIFY